ncbi:TetR/AcrR family transcriptional regulator [Amycolatopsis sp. CA-230715]|uniref:TetR/AcrR family transcriptional regulator n=1 Tax=Amycolatopsis sp. CA-230715 TaxID=2745196 RepID=UPI001C02E06C|nr:TetR family transcriptional regulator [Amycolatopsis sp. CA-230715]QWF83489.1 HTH-type transcriptional regulator RcdA [Amycolatopsis sp. CA-230715]
MPGRRGQSDPGRREKILTAAETVVVASGVAGLTHRAVAKEADVPLGSTTYYFATLSELRQAALRRLFAQYRDWLHDWAEGLGEIAAADLAEELADLMRQAVGEYREHIVVEYELTILALRDPAMAEVSAEYSEYTTAVFAELVGKEKAIALSALLDGLYLRVLTERTAPSRREIVAALTTVLRP